MARLRRASPVAKGAAHGGSTLRFVVTFFALLAFSLQSYVTQTHIHIAPDKTVSYGGKSARNVCPTGSRRTATRPTVRSARKSCTAASS